MSVAVQRSNIKDCLLSLTVSVLLSAILVLLFAVITKFMPVGDNLIPVFNLCIKALSVFLGVLTQVKNGEKGFVKGALTGVLFALISLLIFILLDGEFNWGTFSLEAGVCLAAGVLSGIFASGRKK